jgi:hypothetical protein
MDLTAAQLATLKAYVNANHSGQQDQTVADAMNAPHAPDFWVWRTAVTKAELVSSTSVDGTTFNWTGAGFITRSQGERDAWRELFNGTQTVNPTLANVRQAFLDIFSGATAPAPANRTHLATVSRRKATVAEELFATGTGSTASPGVLATGPTGAYVEGPLTAANVSEARNLP